MPDDTERLELYESAFENMQAGLMIFQLEDPSDPSSLRLLAANAAARKAGYSANVEPEAHLTEAVSGNLERMASSFAEVARSGKAQNLGEVHYSAGGIDSTFSIRAFPVSGQRVGVIYEDFTEHVRSESERRLLKDTARVHKEADIDEKIDSQWKVAVDRERLKTIVDFSSAFIGYATLDGNMVFLNNAGQRMVGLDDTDDVHRTALRDFFAPGDHDYLDDHILPTVREEERWLGEFRLQHLQTGETVPVYLDLFTIPDPDTGEPLGIGTVTRDITEQKETADELREAKEKAEEANRTKGQFLANMSHELRTPLNAIIGYSRVLREDAEKAGQDQLFDDLERINRAGKQLLNLVNDVLDLSKIEAGKMTLHLEDFAVCDVLEEVADTIQPVIEENGNQLRIQCDEEAVGAMHADATKVRQVLFNLLSNAAKFTEDGAIELSAWRESAEDRDWILLSVEDTGIGMSREEQRALFEAFEQGDPTASRSQEGTGLGLTITRNLCNMMGGAISVKSERGEGSTFTLRLPARVENGSEAPASAGEERPVEPVSDMTEDVEGQVADATEGEPPSDTDVLVIDDNPDARDLIARYLTRKDFNVATAAGGREGLERARRVQPDVITLDVMMPEMDGWAVLSALQDDPDLRDVPVVMITIVDNEEMGYMLGASDYLTKPLDPERLAEVINKHRPSTTTYSVLVVEDEAPVRELVRYTLEEEGWTVYEAEHGKVALAVMNDAFPDVIVLDLMMPEMDGFEFIEKLHAGESQHEDVPIIVITAKSLSTDEREELSGQVNKVLQKGEYNREELLREVSERIEKASTRADASS
jgi:PAS domain S-box-containing protein